MSERTMEAEIKRRWRQWEIGKTIADREQRRGEVTCKKVNCERQNCNYSLWRLGLQANWNEEWEIFLKIFLRGTDGHRSSVELGMYRYGSDVLGSFLPGVFGIEEVDDETWVFMERTRPLAGRFPFTPSTFDKIIPVLAACHSQTSGKKASKVPKAFRSWLPVYGSDTHRARRAQGRQMTIRYLSKATQSSHLWSMLQPHYQTVRKVLKQAPIYFPELLKAPHAVIHGDLHTHNICCNDLNQESWDIRFIDWETAQFAPVWLDLIVLVEILMDFHKDWHDREDDIRRHCTDLYVRDMNSHGISVPGPHLNLYKMAYLDRTLDIGLATQLRRELDGRPGKLLPRYLAKIEDWGEELGLIKG